MNRQLHGIVIRVENLEICRAFYRDILQLGNPVMDSNFWVEFKLRDESSLFLEKMDEQVRASAARNRFSWIYDVEDTNALIDRLSDYGYESTTTRTVQAGYSLIKFYDPEGNSFYVADQQN